MNNTLLIENIIFTFTLISLGRECISKEDILSILLDTDLKTYKDYILRLVEDMKYIDGIPNYVHYEKKMENVKPYSLKNKTPFGFDTIVRVEEEFKKSENINFLDFMYVLRDMVSFAETPISVDE